MDNFFAQRISQRHLSAIQLESGIYPERRRGAGYPHKASGLHAHFSRCRVPQVPLLGPGKARTQTSPVTSSTNLGASASTRDQEEFSRRENAKIAQGKVRHQRTQPWVSVPTAPPPRRAGANTQRTLVNTSTIHFLLNLLIPQRANSSRLCTLFPITSAQWK